MGQIMGYEDIIEKIKEATGATDEEIAQKAQEIEKRYGPVIKTKDFLYYRVAEDCFKVKMPKITEIGRRKCKEVTTEELLDKELAKKLSDDNISVSIEGYVFSPRDALSKKKKPKINFSLIDKTGTVSASVVSEPGVQNWNDLDIKNGDYVAIENAGIFMRDAKSRPSVNIGQFSIIEKLKKAEGMESVVVNVAESVANDGAIVYTEGFVTDLDVKKYIGCSECYKKMTDKDGNELDKCPKCKKAIETEEFSLVRLNVFDGSVSVVVSLTPQIAKETDYNKFAQSFLRIYGRWNKVRNEIGYFKHETVEKFSPVDARRKKLAAAAKQKEDLKKAPKLKKLKDEEINGHVEQPEEPEEPEDEPEPEEKPKTKSKGSSKLTKEQMQVFEGVVKFYKQASTTIVTKTLINKAEVKNEKDAAKVIDIAVAEGLVKKIKNGAALEWIKQ